MDVKPGDICSVASDDTGRFSVVKILAVQPGVLTVRIYTNVYDERPMTVDPSTLRLQDADGWIGAAAIPMKPHHLESWEPHLILNQPLREDEMEVCFVPARRRRIRDLFRRE
jgi:hypothetical protein